MSVNINNIVGTGNNYLELFDGVTAGKSYDASRRFYGNETETSVSSNTFISIVIDGNTYYLEILSGSAQLDCCSNLVGTTDSVGGFISAGFVMVDVNGTLRFVQVFSLL